jgi:hypothetical protein
LGIPSVTKTTETVRSPFFIADLARLAAGGYTVIEVNRRRKLDAARAARPARSLPSGSRVNRERVTERGAST